jgi:hypothetical protein
MKPLRGAIARHSLIPVFAVLCFTKIALPNPLSIRSAFLPAENWRLGFSGGILKRPTDEKLYLLPELGLAYTVQRKTEISVNWPFLILKRNGQSALTGSGDVFLSSRTALFQKKNWAAGFCFGIKLPNAKDEKRLGTDETDFYFSGLFSQRIGLWEFSQNLGLGILGNPTALRAQEDVYTYGLSAALRSGRAQPFIEWHGQASPHPEYVLSRLVAGMECRWPKLSVKISGLKSLTEKSKGYQNILGADWGLKVGLEWSPR